MSKKKILAILLSLLILGCKLKKENNITKSYNYEYSKGKIYIGELPYLSILLNLDENDIFIQDLRYAKDPDMKIYDSYLITDFDLIDEVLNTILLYEKENPSNWERTLESMRIEWFFHNLSYYLNYKQERTKDVDLNNGDEEIYKKIKIDKK